MVFFIAADKDVGLMWVKAGSGTSRSLAVLRYAVSTYMCYPLYSTFHHPGVSARPPLECDIPRVGPRLCTFCANRAFREARSMTGRRHGEPIFVIRIDDINVYKIAVINEACGSVHRDTS